MKVEERLFDDASAEVQRLPDAKKLSQHEIRELKVLIKDCHCKPPVAVDGTRCLQFLHGGAPGVIMPLWTLCATVLITASLGSLMRFLCR